MLFFALSSSTWDGLSDGVAILIIAVLLLLGLLLGYALRGLVGRWQAESIEKKMRLRDEEAEAEIKARLKEADIAARATVVKVREEFEASTKKRRAELQAIEDRQTQREANLDRKAATLDERETAAAAKSAEELLKARREYMMTSRLYSFDTMSDVISAAKVLPADCAGISSLYREEQSGKLYLLLKMKDVDELGTMQGALAALSEYGHPEKVTPARQQYLITHCTAVIKEDAIGTLSEL